MSELHPYLWLIPALPLAAAALIAFLGPRFLRGRSHLPCIAAGAAACVLSVLVLFAVRGLDKVPSAEEAVRAADESGPRRNTSLSSAIISGSRSARWTSASRCGPTG